MGDAQLSQQLDGVQENVIDCMNIASDVMDLLADEKQTDPSFKASCERFLERVAASQVTCSVQVVHVFIHEQCFLVTPPRL